MRKITYLACLFLTTALNAQIADNFDRGPIPASGFTTAVNSSPFSAGSGAGTWDNGTAAQEWRISEDGKLIKNILSSDGALGHSVLYNSGFDMLNGGTITADFTFDSGVSAGVRGGIAANFQDSNNGYFLRIQNTTGSWHFMERVSGSFTTLASGTASANFSGDHTYTLSISNDNSGTDNLSYSIAGANISTITGTVTNNNFTDGFGGLYAGNNNSNLVNQEAYIWDNFSAVSVIPEPGTYGLILSSLAFVGLMVRRRRS